MFVLAEHFLYNINKYLYVKTTKKSTDVLYNFLSMDYGFMFRYFPYSPTLGILLNVQKPTAVKQTNTSHLFCSRF